jgi:hypothetical protein
MLKVVVVGMIYKSPSYLDFMMQGIRKYALTSSTFSVNYLVIANDPIDGVRSKLVDDGIKFIEYNDSNPNNYYLNRVYRAWNFGGMKADGDIIIFINSDMAFSPNWLENLLHNLNEQTIPCSRLVESGKLISAEHAISKDFGRTAESFDEKAFLEFAQSVEVNEVHERGLFMPCAFYKRDFVKSEGYPEGNMHKGGAGRIETPILDSGDNYFFKKNPVMSRKKHITVFNSIVYHIQEGELDE